MLDRAGNPDRDINAGSDDLAGLTDLIIIRRVTRINGRPRGPDRGAQLVGKGIDQGVELLGRTERPTARNDDRRARQLGSFAMGDFLTDEARQALVASAADRPDLGGTAL